MQITPDFSEASEATGPAQIQPGFYNARIKDVEKKTSQTGNDYLAWTLQIFGAEGEMSKANNRLLTYRTMLAGKAAGMLRDFWKAATGEAMTGSADTDDVLSKEVLIQVVDGVRDGKPTGYPEVKRVKALQS